MGPQGPSGIVDHRFASGPITLPPTYTMRFIGPTVTAPVAFGQRVFVNSSAALGALPANGLYGAESLTLWICYQEQSSLALALPGQGLGGLKVASGERVTFSLSTVVTGLMGGTYQFGLCGTATSGLAPWNNNGNSYTRALIF